MFLRPDSVPVLWWGFGWAPQRDLVALAPRLDLVLLDSALAPRLDFALPLRLGLVLLDSARVLLVLALVLALVLVLRLDRHLSKTQPGILGQSVVLIPDCLLGSLLDLALVLGWVLVEELGLVLLFGEFAQVRFAM